MKTFTIAELSANHNHDLDLAKRALLLDLAHIAKPYLSISQIVLFGSRARGNFHRTSDFDVCIFCEDEQDFVNYYSDAEDIDTFYSIDVVRFDKISNDALKCEIQENGVVLYERK